MRGFDDYVNMVLDDVTEYEIDADGTKRRIQLDQVKSKIKCVRTALARTPRCLASSTPPPPPPPRRRCRRRRRRRPTLLFMALRFFKA